MNIPLSEGLRERFSMSFIVHPGWEEMKYGTIPVRSPFFLHILSNSMRSLSKSLKEGLAI